MVFRRKGGAQGSSAVMLDAARGAAQQRLAGFARRAADAGTPIEVGQVLLVLPARCLPLDHAAIAWAHAAGVPAPPGPTGLGAELVATTAGVAYTTFPVPYVWWRRWEDVQCSRTAVAGRRNWRQRTASVFVSDRVPPFEGRAFELPTDATRPLMDLAVQHGAVSPGSQPA